MHESKSSMGGVTPSRNGLMRDQDEDSRGTALPMAHVASEISVQLPVQENLLCPGSSVCIRGPVRADYVREYSTLCIEENSMHSSRPHNLRSRQATYGETDGEW